MAYIHKTTFEILHELPDEWKDDYFECDELVAPVIRALNLKGYTTRFCCSGHAYPSLNEAKFEPKDKTKPPKKSPISGTYFMEPCKDGWYYVKFKTYPERNFYISFEPGTALPEPPEGFKLLSSLEQPKGVTVEALDDDGKPLPFEPAPILEKGFSNKTSDYSFYRLLLAAMRRLLEWAEALPDLTRKP